ncbi:hypothetical protein PLEOSDRAFT_1108667 [Pleurotus ostreatus PC15]|uniref:Uncharacterized protein n=1 Tax=Pleurotus ostreatus (strain PC15) TaxID=1137138 RepID=A0A067NGY9_PLEO1|nr:hypothetical protein PLEOSDRAFT_1108667 [Pleurotus ostreatus PC15]
MDWIESAPLAANRVSPQHPVVTEAEASGEATKTDAPTTEGETEGVAKPEKKKSARRPRFTKAEGDVSEAPALDAEGALSRPGSIEEGGTCPQASRVDSDTTP